MRSIIARLTLGMFAAAAIATISPASASTYAVVSSFSGGGSDGYYPVSGLLNVGGIAYGTTPFGGTGSCSGPAGSGCGTIYALNLATGVRTIVHSFTGSDGTSPSAVLINISGILYGTTGFGGASCSPSGCGTVFKFDPSTSTLTTLHSFAASGGDGTYPFSSLINVSGTLYGTTQYGGSSNNGSVYTINPSSGAESVVYSFAGGSDGSQSIAGLINISGKLYGTTLHGGSAGEGTVFAYDTGTGTESVVYSFQGGSSDGANPYAGVINVSGTLYGATRHGGTGCSGTGCGTVYSLNPSTGTETVVHFFSGSDGANPEANLLNAGGTLYGTTLNGGVSASSTTGGTLYSIDTATSAETVLHSFGAGSDGNQPRTSLILTLGGVLYGTTIAGGASNLGTVFSYTP